MGEIFTDGYNYFVLPERKTTMTILTRTRGHLATGSMMVRALAVTGAALAIALCTPLVSSAATGVTVTPNSGPAGGFTTSVTVQGTELGHQYRVGLCSKANVGTPATAPACTYVGTGFSGTGGDVTQTGNVQAQFTNAHASIPGQPATFDCGTDQCQIVVTDNHSSGSFPTLNAPITFN